MISIKKFLYAEDSEEVAAPPASVADSSAMRALGTLSSGMLAAGKPSSGMTSARAPEVNQSGANQSGASQSAQTQLLSAYQAALTAIGLNGQRAVPALGSLVDTAMSRINEKLGRSASPESIQASRGMVEDELSLWADKAEQHQQQSDQAIRDLLIVVRRATESNGVRDEKFSREIAALSERLRTVAGLDSMAMMRRSITENAGALTNCVARMVEEGQESVRKLTSEIADYQTRLVASERRAMLDPLTGLYNRRGFEQQLDLRVGNGQPFSLLVADLNGFKAANDRYGHMVGDEILKQFAGELKGQFPPGDTVARWGGDEFVGMVAGSAAAGLARVERVRHWVLGEYKIPSGNQTIAITVDAALGVTNWDGAESGSELFARADKEMYRAKRESRELAQV